MAGDDALLPIENQDDADKFGNDEEGTADSCEHVFLIQDPLGQKAKVHMVRVYDMGWRVPACRSSTGRFSKLHKYRGWSPRDWPCNEQFTIFKE